MPIAKQPSKSFFPAATSEGTIARNASRVPGMRELGTKADEPGTERDTVKEALDQARDADYGPLREKVFGVIDALNATRVLLWKSMDRFFELVSVERAPVREASVAHAEALVPRIGPPGMNRQGMLEAEALAFERQAAAALRARVQIEFREQAAGVGEKAATAMSDLRTAIDFEAQKLTFWPGSLSDQEEDLTKIIKAEQRRVDVSSKAPSEIKAMFVAAREAGRDDACQQIEQASEAYLQSMVNGGVQKLARHSRPEARDGVASEQIGTARWLLYEFAKAREARLPDWLTFADGTYTGVLLPLFRNLIGVQAKRLSMAQVYEAGRRGGIGLAVDPDWVSRALDDGVAGWIPIRGRNQHGVYR